MVILLNRNFFKIVVILIIVIIFSTFFTGFYSIQSIDDLAYAVAIGIDSSDIETIRLTLQFTKPNSTQESTPSKASPSFISTVDCSSLDAGINIINSQLSKQANLSHCKVVVISEKLASKGISKEIYSLVNKVQIRPDVNLVISKCSAQQYIFNAKPNLENLVSKYYEILSHSSNYTAYSYNVKIGDFFNNITDNSAEAFAILRYIWTEFF